MDHSQYRAVAPPSPPSPASRPNKVILQRQYREKEGECFNILRDVIKELIGEELQTRQEILRKAIDLLSTALEIRKSRQARAVHPTRCGARAEDAGTSAHMGYPAEPSSSSRGWQSTAEFDAELASYIAQSGQQQHLMVNVDTSIGMSQAGYNQYPQGEGWPGYGF